MDSLIKTNINKLSKPQRMGYAKISREKLRSFSKGNLNLTKNAANLILGMSKYVDSTSRIVISLGRLSRELNMQRKTFNHVLSLAKFNGLIYKKNGAYYSNFHVITAGESSTMDYINPLDEFSSATFLNMTLNQQRLLGYILTSSMPGTPQTYNIVKLYNNKMKKTRLSKGEDSGLDIFPTLKDFLINLAILVKNDQVEVILKKMADTRQFRPVRGQIADTSRTSDCSCLAAVTICPPAADTTYPLAANIDTSHRSR